MIIQPAKRTESVKEYYFSIKNREIARLDAGRKSRGEDPVINLGIGSPDGMPPAAALETLTASAVQPGVHGYQSYTGIPELRQAFAGWYARYYGVTLDPTCEIQPLTGSKEGILLISLTFLNAGDKVLVPDPGYPTYTSASQMTEAEIVKYDLVAERGWQPDFEALEAMDLTGVKLMWTNYPGMPTGAHATEDLYERLVAFGRRHGILIVNDNPYSFIRNDRPLSILAAPGARECCLEMNSLSKAHNMAGWRLGMVAGEADYIREILKVKSQMDSGIFRPLQLAAVEALRQGPEWFEALNAEYRRRAEVAYRIMDALGAAYDPGSAGLFVWGRLPSALPSESAEGKTAGERMSDRILYEAGVFITPGFIFGRNGEDYVRISLCAPVPVLEKALAKIRNLPSVRLEPVEKQ
ncbi:MAG: aminotransferase class I/II-fold pyridoxal phosphate-dependent enzyme [Bacteroidales bacterium]|nr:aminotransferase class I/II-fold pyridoxal phosphate-dependent enzyme [Bacteroidales bacterium]